jgi:hypothetical protein
MRSFTFDPNIIVTHKEGDASCGNLNTGNVPSPFRDGAVKQPAIVN